MVVMPSQNSYFVNFFSALIKFTFCDLFFTLSRCRPLTSKQLNPASLIVQCKGIQRSPEFWIAHRGLWILATGFSYLSVELGFWIPIVCGISDSLSCIPVSKTHHLGFHIQKFLGIRIPLHSRATLTFSQHQYLPHLSGHPIHTKRAIPLSLHHICCTNETASHSTLMNYLTISKNVSTTAV